MPENTMTEASTASLINGLADAKRELFNLRFQLATGQLENTARIREVKKDVARYNTEIRAREIEAAESASSTRADNAEGGS
ncbi:MAG: 50S ribosomal protein L29 [Actinomycetota bacterium]